ncbi:carbohydrate ABC transporter permease [Nonomuraea jiangxiensis]|uniref:Multiple sugar transport system permease protein n=1 Tax=Nonomuraea jiangxiensis TaxID=633440 RepID=A0A1G9ASA3_9ACTN|nr:sugar ABC transporter permease [Nonomuraea jiangxiensis]SDK30208.1 multiple sugar transport system permease protein [Nonomuraea jiangxiensis]
MSLLFAGRHPATRRVALSAGRARWLSRSLVGWGFAGPATALIIGLSIFPAVWAFLISRQKWNGISPAKPIGWLNYQLMAQDPDLFAAVRHTVVFTVLFVPASIFLGMLIAVALNRPIRLVGFYRTCIFIPFVASAAATGILANFVFNPQYGAANSALRVLGLPQQQFLESQSQALLVICLIALWGQVGFSVVVYLAALQDIPKDVVEAARIDGANNRQVFRHVTLPQLGPVTVFTAIWQTITALQLFDLVFTTTRGGPLGATQTIVYYVYSQAFELSKFGYGSAVAYGLFAVTLLITAGMILYSRRSKIEAF